CNMLTRAEMESGKVPTTPTIASIIAGIQAQEAVKLIHGLPTLAGKAFVFEGLHHTSYRLEYTQNEDCMSHHRWERIERLPIRAAATTLHELWERACKDLGARAVLEFSRDIIQKLSCPRCGKEQELFRPLGSVSFEEGRCPVDQEMRIVTTAH